MRQSRCGWDRGKVLAICYLLMGSAFGQQTLETNFRMSGMGVLAAFENQREVIQKCSAVLYDGRSEIAYGVVISDDGYVLTKASEIAGADALNVRIDRESFDKATVVVVDDSWDVALLKVDGKGLTPADFAESSDGLEQGTWLVVNGATSRTKRRILAGIVSASPREIEPDGGAVLGVELEEEKDALMVKAVSEKSGAEEAGVKVGDQILSVDGEGISGVGGLTEFLKDKKAGKSIDLMVIRDGEEILLKVRLSARGEVFQELDRNDQMSGDFSERRSGFPRVMQHDILANSSTMGGPVITLDGKVVGMNIARANRAETFAIPVEELKKLADSMLAGAKR
ncbi:S1C family serine protease [Luteolibacter sp. AS25]|uniref:S1C family serine protease n=1 Tax=Luteolibacter sp. AS25 TaxID=3135776 RepID=UPI00398AE7F2